MKRSSKFTSKTAQALTGLDTRKMSRSELASAVSVMASAANKRIKRAEQAGQPLGDTFKHFSVAGKDRNELLKEFSRVKNFLQNPTASLSGQANLARETAKGIARKTLGADVTGLIDKYGVSGVVPAEMRESVSNARREFKEAYASAKNVIGGYKTRNNENYWRAYERLAERHPEARKPGFKYTILSKQIQYMQGHKRNAVGDIYRAMEKEFSNLYEAEQETMVSGEFYSDGFEL